MIKVIIFVVNIFIVFSISVKCANFDSEQAQLLVKHLDVLRELKTTFDAKKDDTYSNPKKQKLIAQTDIHRKFSCLNKIINATWGSFLTA